MKIRVGPAPVLLGLALFATPPGAQALPSWQVQALATPGNPSSVSRANDINASGQIVGQKRISGTSHVLYWQGSSFVADLGDEGTGVGPAGVQAINDAGQVAGTRLRPGDSHTSPYTVNVNGASGLLSLPSPAGVNAGHADVGNNGLLVGRVTWEDAKVWDPVTQALVATLPDPNPGTGQISLAYSTEYDVALGFVETAPAVFSAPSSAVYWELQAGSWIPTDVSGSVARDFSTLLYHVDQDLFLGQAFDGSDYANRGAIEAFVYDRTTGQATFLPAPAGADLLPFDAITNGWAVVTAQYANGTTQALVYDLSDPSNIQYVALPDLVAGGSGSWVHGINDSGWIVGSSANASGTQVATLWSPVPEPGTALLAAGGLVGLGVGRRRRRARPSGLRARTRIPTGAE